MNILGFYITQVHLLTNNPQKKSILEQHPIDVIRTIPLVSHDPKLKKYLETKRDRLGHFISFQESLSL